MRLSRTFIPTLKEIPSDAVTQSHRLMLRAGMIRSLGAGIYSYLPFFWKTLNKVIGIVRAEMDASGAQELLLPALNPVEVWKESGRHTDFGQEKFNFSDRKGHEMTLAPTHEEIICDLARSEIRSYKELPQVWYQIQTKFRDEPRPRSGVLRTRQFIMKDAYSLDTSWEGLDKSYESQREAYKKIFTRCGLDFFIVGASSGLMGGRASEEFMLETPAGEDTCAVCQSCGYAANVEVASSVMKRSFGEGGGTLQEVHTPGQRTIEEVTRFLNKPASLFIKALFYIAEEEPVMILIAGPDELSQSKFESFLGKQIRPALPEEVIKHMKAPAGYIGPAGMNKSIPLYADRALEGAKGMVCGANREDYHLIGVDLAVHTAVPQFGDFRVAQEGESCIRCGKPLKIIHAIELGHIFKLGTKYSDAMGATFLDAEGKAKPIIMGSYGIGMERIVAAHIEQHADQNGIIWKGEIAPFTTAIIPLNNDEEMMKAAEELYNQLLPGYEPLFDDRDVRAGVKFKDADLLGIPVQIILGRGFSEGKVEVKFRNTGERVEKLLKLGDSWCGTCNLHNTVFELLAERLRGIKS